MPEISTKPYMLRAIYEWCTDSGYTPYLAVKVDAGTTVPMEYVKNSENLHKKTICCTTRVKIYKHTNPIHPPFGGVSREIFVPVNNVMAIYANENGQGMAFEPILGSAGTTGNNSPESTAPATPTASAPALSSVPSAPPEGRSAPEQPSPDDNNDPPKKGGRPTLTRIK
jgi:stringent starvation protein B